MKFFYIILNIGFITVIVITVHSFFASTVNPAVRLTKQLKVKKSKPVSTVVVKKNNNKVLDANIAIKYNLFAPNRGNVAGQQQVTRNPLNNSSSARKFKLVGVYRFGKIRGAIILSSPQSRLRSRSRYRRRPVQPASAKQQTKRFYRVGEMVNDGFRLKKVETRTVLLTKGSESITLEIEHNNPIIRESSTPKNKARRVSMHVSPVVHKRSGLSHNSRPSIN